MPELVGLNGVERRKAIQSIDRAADIVAASRWVAFALGCLLSLPIIRIAFSISLDPKFRAFITIILFSLAFCSTFPFISAADSIRMRRERAIQFWFIVSIVVIVLSLTAAILFALFAFRQDDPTSHIIMFVLCMGCAVYGMFVMIMMIKAYTAVRGLKLDSKPFGFEVVQPSPASNSVGQSDTNIAPHLLPPRPNRNAKP